MGIARHSTFKICNLVNFAANSVRGLATCHDLFASFMHMGLTMI